jgi:type I restriction enzyme, S subunit
MSKATKLPAGWSVGTMDDVVAGIVAGTSVNCDDRKFEDGDKRVLKLSAVSGGRLKPSDYKVVSRGEHSRLKTPLKAGTVLLTRKNTPQLVGDSAYVSESAETYLPDLIWELSPKDGIDPRWLNHCLQTSEFRKQIGRLCAGSSKSMVGISQEGFLDTPVSIPPHDEQTRIVTVLDQWDQVIDQTERLIHAERLRYRGLIGRYSAEFHDQRIEFGQLVHLVSDRVQPGSQNSPSKSIELENIEPETGRLMGSETVDGDSALRACFHSGDTLFGKLRPYLNKFLHASCDGICSTEIWVLRAKEGVLDPELLFFLVQTQEFDSAANKQSGSRMPRADWDVVGSAPIPCPNDLGKQARSAVVLSSALNTVHLELRKLDSLLLQKRSLMQKLLSGEWRLDARFDLPVVPGSPNGTRKVSAR